MEQLNHTRPKVILTEEGRRKIAATSRETQKRIWADPALKEERRAAMKAAWASPELRARMSKAMKDYYAARK